MKVTILSLLVMASGMSAMEEVDYSFTAGEYETFQDAMRVRTIVESALKKEGVYFRHQYDLDTDSQLSCGIAVLNTISDTKVPQNVITPWGVWEFVREWECVGMGEPTKGMKRVEVEISEELGLERGLEFFTVIVSRHEPKIKDKEALILREQALKIWWEMMCIFEKETKTPKEYESWVESLGRMSMRQSEWNAIAAVKAKIDKKKNEKSCLIL